MAQQYGLGNFIYEIDVKDGKANFTFRDPEDASNTADVTIAEADFPEGVVADDRRVADLAFDQCQRLLNEKRDARIKKEAADATAEAIANDTAARQNAQDFLSSAQHVAVVPHHVEEDGTTVYNSAPPADSTDDKKKK
jgi:regulator of protease activity HflC (stomatin/prohibitin superfamily)